MQKILTLVCPEPVTTPKSMTHSTLNWPPPSPPNSLYLKNIKNSLKLVVKLKELGILKEEIERKLRSKRVNNLNDNNTAQNCTDFSDIHTTTVLNVRV